MSCHIVTAASLRAILCFIDPEDNPKIACFDDSMAEPLIERVKLAVTERSGSNPVRIAFGDSEHEQRLLREFCGVCDNIASVFGHLEDVTNKPS